MSEGNYNFEKIYTGKRRTNRFWAVAATFVLVVFFGAAESVFAQREVSVGKQTLVKKFDFQIDPKSLVIDYNPQTVEIDKTPSIAKIVLSEDRTELKVEGLKAGKTAIKLRLKDVVIPVMTKPNETPKEQGDLFIGTLTVTVVGAKSVKADPKSYEISRGAGRSPTLSSVMGSAQFSYANQEGKMWRILETRISARGRQFATVKEDTAQNLARLRITGKKVGKMTFYLIGEEKVEDADADYWREITVRIDVNVLGQKPKPPETPEEFAEKIKDELDAQIADLANLLPEEKTELRDELEALEERLDAKIKALEENGIDATEAILFNVLRALLDDVTRRKSQVEKSINGENVNPAKSTVIFDRLKQRYKRELKPAAANAENLSDAQKTALRREWEPIPNYVEQLIGEETKSVEPREALLQEMKSLRKAIRDDLEKLQTPKNLPLVYIHYVNSRRQDAEMAAEILKKNGFRTEFNTLGNVQIAALNGKILYAPNGSAVEAKKIAGLVKTITAVTPESGTPTVTGERWIYFLVIYDPNGFR